MENFFARKEEWRNAEGALHLYVLPTGDELLDRLAGIRGRLEGAALHLPTMPETYLHLTVQRLAHFDDEVSQAELSRLGAALTEGLASVPPFSLELQAPAVTADSVVCHAEATDEWRTLVDTVRTVLQDWGGAALPDPPAAPHLTVAYATGTVDDEVVAARLAECEAPGAIVVDEVHLVSVTERPEVGIFDFTTYASWSLA